MTTPLVVVSPSGPAGKLNYMAQRYKAVNICYRRLPTELKVAPAAFSLQTPALSLSFGLPI